jgi:hypothetical protein
LNIAGIPGVAPKIAPVVAVGFVRAAAGTAPPLTLPDLGEGFGFVFFSIFSLGRTLVEVIYFILIVCVYYRQCDGKSGLAFIQLAKVKA